MCTPRGVVGHSLTPNQEALTKVRAELGYSRSSRVEFDLSALENR